MYVYSIPLDGGECSLLKKHGKLSNLIILSDGWLLSFYLDLKNVDQHEQKPRQESAPINIAEN